LKQDRGIGLQVTPISGALGAEIAGVDLSAPLPEATVTAIRHALLDHLVVFFLGRCTVS